MSVIINNAIDGVLQLKAQIEALCVNDLTNEELLRLIPELYAATLEAANLGVIVSIQTPGESDRDKLWVRRDTRGAFVGLYAWQGRSWEPVYDVAEGERRWIDGNSNLPPKGWKVIEEGDAVIPSYVVNAAIAQYVPLSVGEGWAYYAVRYVGFDEEVEEE